MIQDLSKQDIAAQPEEFSVEDIIREFSERMPAPKEEPKKVAAEVPFDSVSGGIRGQQTVPQEGTEPLSEAAEAPEKPASFEEPVLQNAQAEARQSPAPAPMSQSEIASAIAQVVESAFAAPAPANEPQEMQAVSHTVEQDRESKQTREQKRQQGHAPSPEQAAERKVLETVQTDLEQAAPQEPVTQPVTSEEDKEVLKKKNDVPESQDQSSQKEEQQPRETVEKPNTRHVKIPRSRRTPGALEYIGTMILDIRRRQMAALPASGVSLRGREKQMLVTARIERIFSYFRYGILLLMCMCLAGRRFQWMSLGFMQGLGGTYTALVLTVLCFFFSWQSTIRAVRDLWYFRFSFESLLLIATVVSMLEALSSKNEASLLPLLTIAWCLSGTADMMNVRGNLRALRGVITGRSRKGVRVAYEKWEGRDCIGKAPASLVNFVRHQVQQDVFHTVISVYGLLFLIVCLVISAYFSGKTQQSYLTILATLLSVGVPVGAALCCARPYELLCRALSGQGAVAGWYGVKGLSGKKSVLIYDRDLFPKGATQHKGVRVYGTMDPRLLTSYGASMIFRSGIGLDAVFTQLLREMNGEVFPISHFHCQESGMEGYIHHNLVQVGSFQYMQLMGISLPSHAPRYGIYLAVNQHLEGVFAIKYEVAQGAPAGFHRFVREPELSPILVTRNFCVNPAFVEHWFGAPITSLICPKADTRQQLSEPSLMQQGATCGFVFKEGVGPYSRLVAGARRVYRMGLFFSLAALLISCYTTVKTILALAAETAIVTGPRLLLIQLVFLLLVEICARIAVRK